MLTETPEPGKYNPNYDSILKKSPSFIYIKEKEVRIIPQNSKFTQINTQKEIRKNHALKFSDYSFRKDIHEKQNKGIDVISYVNPSSARPDRKGPDFNKMSHRNKNDFLNMNSLNNPSICYYEPKYDYVLKSPPKGDLKFTHSKKFYSKKFLVQKMWKSYDVSTNYKLVKLV